MNNGYQDPKQVENYFNFLESNDGKFQKQIILEAVLKHLNGMSPSSKVLDLGCGPGWLCHELSSRGFNATGSDASEAQINLAKKNYPGLTFVVADAQVNLPFSDTEFDVVISSLAVCDIKNQPAALKEIHRVLKNGGKFINIIPNPYYAYPVGEWKKSLLGKFFGKMPNLKLRDYFAAPPEYVWKNNLPSRFYPLSEQINNTLKAGFSIKALDELRSQANDKRFGRKYQLYRFPLYLLIESISL